MHVELPFEAQPRGSQGSGMRQSCTPVNRLEEQDLPILKHATDGSTDPPEERAIKGMLCRSLSADMTRKEARACKLSFSTITVNPHAAMHRGHLSSTVHGSRRNYVSTLNNPPNLSVSSVYHRNGRRSSMRSRKLRGFLQLHIARLQSRTAP